MSHALVALRKSEEALIKLCERILKRKQSLPRAAFGECSHPPQPYSSELPKPRSLARDALSDMYKNQLQELAQRSCFDLPSYGCLREGPDHAPRFRATVKFNNELFEGPAFCSTLRQAEHAVAEVALQALSRRGPSQSLAAKMLDETGVCKNLLQETAQKAGIPLPVYSSVRSGPGHLPVYICTVEVSGLKFAGQSAKTKKQAEKNAAAAAWAALKKSQNVADTESDEQAQHAVLKSLTAAAQECGDALPSTSSSTFSVPERPPLSREQPRTSRLFGGPEYGQAQKAARASLQEAPAVLLRPDTERRGRIPQPSGGVGLPPVPAPFDLFSARPPREPEWVNPASLKSLGLDFAPDRVIAPVVVPRTLQAVYAAPPAAKEDDDPVSDEESPTARVLKGLRKNNHPTD